LFFQILLAFLQKKLLRSVLRQADKEQKIKSFSVPAMAKLVKPFQYASVIVFVKTLCLGNS
jgi:hypothetical protein